MIFLTILKTLFVLKDLGGYLFFNLEFLVQPADDFAIMESRRMRMISDSNGKLAAGRLLPQQCPFPCDFGRITGEDPVQSSGRPASNIDGGSREFHTTGHWVGAV